MSFNYGNKKPPPPVRAELAFAFICTFRLLRQPRLFVRQTHGVDLTEGARSTSSLRFADGRKLVRTNEIVWS